MSTRHALLSALLTAFLAVSAGDFTRAQDEGPDYANPGKASGSSDAGKVDSRVERINASRTRRQLTAPTRAGSGSTKSLTPSKSGKSPAAKTRERTPPRRVPASRKPATSTDKKAPLSRARRTGDEKTASKDDAAKTAGAPAAAEPQGLGAAVVGFFRAHAVWILTGLGATTALVLTWAFLGGRRKKRGEPYLEPLDSEMEVGGAAAGRRYSSTKISAKDVNARLSGTVEGETVETNREYALVVDEEALRADQPEVDEHTGRTYADEKSIRACLKGRDFDGAYGAYMNQIETDGSSEFHDEVEHTLSEHFIRRSEFDKAARILEHHVATHSPEDVRAETYFNLGYLHVKTGTLKKSRRFFKLFVESNPEPVHAQRAERILQTLDSMN